MTRPYFNIMPYLLYFTATSNTTIITAVYLIGQHKVNVTYTSDCPSTKFSKHINRCVAENGKKCTQAIADDIICFQGHCAKIIKESLERRKICDIGPILCKYKNSPMHSSTNIAKYTTLQYMFLIFKQKMSQDLFLLSAHVSS